MIPADRRRQLPTLSSSLVDGWAQSRSTIRRSRTLVSSSTASPGPSSSSSWSWEPFSTILSSGHAEIVHTRSAAPVDSTSSGAGFAAEMGSGGAVVRLKRSVVRPVPALDPLGGLPPDLGPCEMGLPTQRPWFSAHRPPWSGAPRSAPRRTDPRALRRRRRH